MLIYADERRILETILATNGGGQLRIEESYQGGAIVCRVFFSIVRDEGDGMRDYGYCFAGHHKSSYEAARHEAVANAIERLEEILDVRKMTKVALRETKLRQQHQATQQEAEEAKEAAEEAKLTAEEAREAAESARFDAEDASEGDKAALEEAIAANEALEVSLSREKAIVIKLLEDLEKHGEDRAAADARCTALEARLEKLTNKCGALLAEKNAAQRSNASMQRTINQLVSSCRQLDAKLRAVEDENASLRGPVTTENEAPLGSTPSQGHAPISLE